MHTDVIVIGAGLAGLRSAGALTAAGRSVVVLEASDAVGGRVRTDRVDGFLVDRGFQLFNPAYTEARACLDLDALLLHRFGRGVAVRDRDGLTVLADPTRHPATALGAVGSRYLAPAGLARLGAWAAGRQSRDRDEALAASLDGAGVSGPVRAVAESFLAGVLADSRGETSAAFARYLVGWFLRGTPALPSEGMAAVPAQLTAGLDVRLSHRVEGLSRRPDGVAARTEAGTFTARAAVLAVDAVDLSRFTGSTPPPMRGLATWWFAADDCPTDLPFLFVDADRRGPVVNTAVVSNVAPSYGADGLHLVECSVVLDGEAPTEADVRAHAALLYGLPTSGWQVVAHHAIPRSLPAVAPGARRPAIDLGGGVFVAGDHVEGGSIQGALLSGRLTAQAVLARLEAPA